MLPLNRLTENEPMSRHTTFRTGGNAKWYFAPESREEIILAVNFAKEKNIPYFILGNGSNLLVSDSGFDGLIISLTENFNEITVRGEKITALSGASLPKISVSALKGSLTGMEALSGIPGSLGGALYMNAGAYGSEIGEIAYSVEVLDSSLNIKTLYADELSFTYRHSTFTDSGLIILSAVLSLKKGNEAEIRAAMNDFNKRRRDKQPLEYPSAGSAFKRPEGYFAAKLIDDAGLKGLSVGGAQVSEKHSGFIINKGNATSGEIWELMELVRSKVMEFSGVELEPEVKRI